MSKLDDKVIRDLMKTLKNKSPIAKVGVLGDKNARLDENSNASIGLKHEFGDDTVPQRSFLRVPIIENMQKYLDKSGLFDEEVLKEAIKAKDLKKIISLIGIIGETIVLDAFESGGFGKWKPSNMNNKENKQTLVETQQLRNSITSEVE